MSRQDILNPAGITTPLGQCNDGTPCEAGTVTIPWGHSASWGDILAAQLAAGSCAGNAATDIADAIIGPDALRNAALRQLLSGIASAAYEAGANAGVEIALQSTAIAAA